MTTDYAYARTLDPGTGDVAFDDATGSWPGGQPVAELVVRCLRTPRGRAQRDPTYGLDMTGLDKARDNTPALARAAVLRALDRYVRAGLLRVEAVRAEVRGDRLLLEVDVRDARVPARTAPVRVTL